MRRPRPCQPPHARGANSNAGAVISAWRAIGKADALLTIPGIGHHVRDWSPAAPDPGEESTDRALARSQDPRSRCQAPAEHVLSPISRIRTEKGQPTVGFEPTTRCLQIRRQLNSGRDVRLPCIPRMSIESKESHSGGHDGGYRKLIPRAQFASRLQPPLLGAQDDGTGRSRRDQEARYPHLANATFVGGVVAHGAGTTLYRMLYCP